MTDQEKRALSERLATLAETAGLPTELVWEKHDRCERRHEPFYYIKDDAVVHEGRYCGQCYQEYGNADGYRMPETDEEKAVIRRVFADHPDGFVQKRARDLTNPTCLLPLAEAYFEQPHAAIDWEWYRAKDGWLVYVIDRVRNEDAQFHGVGSTIPEALAQALCAAMEAEKGETHGPC